MQIRKSHNPAKCKFQSRFKKQDLYKNLKSVDYSALFLWRSRCGNVNALSIDVEHYDSDVSNSCLTKGEFDRSKISTNSYVNKERII